MRGRMGLAARITAVAAVLGIGCATAGWSDAGWSDSESSEAGHKSAAAASSPAADSLWAVAAHGESDAWAVGTRYLSRQEAFLTLTEHWDGQNWKVVPSPSPEGIGEQTASILGAVAMTSPNDVWAVGSRSPASTDPQKIPPSHGLIEHWNGATWTVVPGPKSGGHTTGLTQVAAISRTAAWAIGNGTVGGHYATVFMRWNGARWRYLTSPAGTGLSGLAVISAHDIWVVGTKGGAKFHTVAEHWNGSKWTTVPTPSTFEGRTRSSAFSAVGGSSSNNIWAVGWRRYGLHGIDTGTLVEHWDGTKWRAQPSPNAPSSKSEHQLFAVTALSRSSAWAVGWRAASNGAASLIERWNGANWTTVPSDLQPGVTFASLYGVAAVGSQSAWAVGFVNQNGQHLTLIEKWNGTSWQQVPSPNP
jgi:hypothetical protein